MFLLFRNRYKGCTDLYPLDVLEIAAVVMHFFGEFVDNFLSSTLFFGLGKIALIF